MKNDLFDFTELKVQHMKTRRCMWACSFFLSSLYLNYHHEHVWGLLCLAGMLVNVFFSECIEVDMKLKSEKQKENKND